MNSFDLIEHENVAIKDILANTSTYISFAKPSATRFKLFNTKKKNWKVKSQQH